MYFMLLFAVLIMSCNKDDKKNDGDDNKGDGNVSDETIVLSCGDLNDGMVLKKTNAAVDYLIECNSGITGKITIEPGTVVAFGPDAAFLFSSGTLDAQGTEDEPIIFRGEEQVSGYWRGVEINANSNDNQLSHLIIRHAGSARTSCCTDPTSLKLKNGRVSVSDLTVEKGEGIGVYVTSDVRVGNFSRIRVKTHESYPLRLPTTQLEILDGEGSDFSGNDNDLAYLALSKNNSSLIVHKINIPYFITDTWTIGATTTIEPGAQFTFDNAGGIYVEDNASLAINGQASDVVIFQGKIEEPGAWKGIHYGNSVSSKNTIKNAVISDAGRERVRCCDSPASLFVNGRISMNNVVVKNGQGRGITFQSNAEISDFNNVTITSHQQEPIRLDVNQASALDQSSDFTGNSKDYVYLYNRKVNNTSKLRKLNVPYYLNEGGHFVVDATLEIDAGVKMLFDNGGGIYVDNGSMRAVGTSSDPITFEGMVDAKGTWNGIEIGSNNPQNEFRYVNINNAGYARVTCCNVPAALKIGSSAIMTVENSSISNTKGCGLLYDSSSNTVTINDVTYNNNDDDTCEL